MNELSTIIESVKAQLSAGVSPEDVRVAVLGRKGTLTHILRSLATLPLEERVQVGQQANTVKREVEELLSAALPVTADQELPDRTVPAYPMRYGSVHPISAMIQEMVSIFQRLSFEVVEGPELVTENENFQALNIGPDHPARDGHDSFYIRDNLLLRTQTTAVQVLEMHARMQKKQLPIRIVVPGKTYRRESDATHSAMFHQMDGVIVDTQTTFSDLKGTLEYFCKSLFGDAVETRFRPHHFPFTEPSAELDIRWKGETRGSGKHTGWLEMLGCGMIHPAVLERAGLSPRIYQGWAFGMSVERPIMIRQQVPDIRLFTTNSLDFLSQF